MSGNGGGGVTIGGGGGAQGGGLCVFTCGAILSSFGAILALYDYDIGAESAFFAVSGLGAGCFAKCQYLRLIEERSRRKHSYAHRTDWDPAGYGNALNQSPAVGGEYTRRRREDRPWEDGGEEEKMLLKPNTKGKSSKGKNRNKVPGVI